MVLMRKMRLAYWTQVWRRIATAAGDQPIALFGSGLHTELFLGQLLKDSESPKIAFILDSDSRTARVHDIPVLKPESSDPKQVAAVLVCSDTQEGALSVAARAWARDLIPVELLYGSNFDLSSISGLDKPGDIVEWTPKGQRIVTERHGAQRTQSLKSGSEQQNRPAAAIPPVLEKRISTLITTDFTVTTTPIARQVSDTFQPYQIYPGDAHRPGIDLRDEDFVTKPEHGLVTRTTRVSVIGSCFASNFRLWLLNNGYNFCQFEDGPFTSVGSLRTGPLFNPGSVRQLVDWAYYGFTPVDTSWIVDGRLCDPYRKFMSWPTKRDMIIEREAHFAATRNMIEQSDVLILTLGLSEVWRNREDKSCYYLIPPPGILDERYHEHVLLTVDECLSHLDRFYAIVQEKNPKLRLITTLSPVPLMASYFDRHAVVSDAISKATLRTALHWFCQNHPEVIYFPSYEMAVRTPDWPYQPDNRHVHPGPVVDRIMRSFMSNYGDPADLPAQATEAKPGAAQTVA